MKKCSSDKMNQTSDHVREHEKKHPRDREKFFFLPSFLIKEKKCKKNIFCLLKHLRDRRKNFMNKGNIFFLILSKGKKYKKLLQFFPLRQKRGDFFVYNNNIRLCPASLLNKGFCVTHGRFDTKMLI